MRVYVIPADAYGCGHYRLIWPAEALKRQGFDVRLMPPNQKTGFLATADRHPTEPDALLTSVTIPEDADVIVMQRPAHVLQAQMIQAMRDNNVAVVVDMDDNMGAIHPDNVAFQMYRTSTYGPMSWRNAASSCRVATLVTTSTPALKGVYAGHGRGMVLDNYVPRACLKFERGNTGAFGWAGTTSSHPDDLQVTGRTFQRLIDEGHPFTVVGGKSKVKQAARLDAEPHYTGSLGLGSWVERIAQEVHVGTIPLSPSAFNTSKSRLKGIEYMSVGVPWVASPREEYRRLNRESSCGLLADTPKQWYSHLKALLTDETLYKEQSEAGKSYMADQTYEANAWRWAEAWTRAREIQDGRREGTTVIA